MTPQVKIVSGIAQIDASEWDALNGTSPVLRHAFFATLEDTACVGEGTGWQPYALTLRSHGQLLGAMPLYLKSHSYGEYVFDWAWADAYERSGMQYYPKLLSAIPFTPITGSRLMLASASGSNDPAQPSADALRAMMLQVIEYQMQQNQLSSAHVLFADDLSAAALAAAGWLERSGVQFRWENEAFADFDDFLSRLAHDKRKKIRQERKKIAAENVVCRQIMGPDISQEQWDFFFRCYENTYREHHSTPYLTREFFYVLGQRMPENILLVLAEQAGHPIAAALNIYDKNVLYGRYWGALTYVPGLHFELCYYQAQEFCIAHGIRYFEGGAQGIHKLARGFRPRTTRSYHKIAHPESEAAIRQFLSQEGKGMDVYQHELEERAPFKKP